jgi:hypothetical protein
MGFLIRPPGCLLAPIFIPLAIPILFLILAFKLVTILLRDLEATRPTGEKVRSAHRHRARSKQRSPSPFAGLGSRRNEPTERTMKRHAQQLFSEISEALDHNQRISSDNKSSLKEQTRQMTDYAVSCSENLARIRRRKTIVSSARKGELTRMEGRLMAEIKRALDILEDALVSIVRVDVVGGHATIDRLVYDLSESNARLRDIADAHDEIRIVREAWVGELD